MATAEINHSPVGEKEKNNAAMSSVGAAIFLTSMKIVVGILTGSLGILSEAAHSGLDLIAAAVTFFAVRVSSRPPDKGHTYGYGKVENISALFETVLLLVTCVWIIYEALDRLFFKTVEVEASVWAFIIMAVSIAVDYTRSRLLARVAKKYNSQALEADALHFSTDIWSSSVVIGGLFLVLLSRLLKIEWLAKADAVAAMGVAGIVVYVSLEMGKKTIADLIDAIPPGLRDEVIRAAEKVPGVLEVRQVRLRRSGAEIFADISATINRDTPFESAHDIANQIEQAVHETLPGTEDVVVNIIPTRSNDEGIITQVRLLAARHNLGAHGIRIYDVMGNRSIEMHLEVEESLSLVDAHHQVTEFENALRQAMPGLNRITTHIEPAGEKSAQRVARPEDEKRLLEVLENMHEELGLPGRPHDVEVNRVGGELSVTFHIALEGNAPITEAHLVTERVEALLRSQVPNLGRVVIHVEPPEEAGLDLPSQS